MTWNQPVGTEVAQRTLVDAAVAGGGLGNPASILGLVPKREEEGSTFFNEGVAFPHARVENLETPVVAMGVTRQGVAAISTAKPVEYIFLVLTPRTLPPSRSGSLGSLRGSPGTGTSSSRSNRAVPRKRFYRPFRIGRRSRPSAGSIPLHNPHLHVQGTSSGPESSLSSHDRHDP